MFFSDMKEMRDIRCTLFSSPPAKFDPVMGYRWLSGFHMVRVIKGEVIIDRCPRINSSGYVSEVEYLPKKSSPDIFRIIVLGDSFTNCIYMEHTWPEMLQYLLRSHPEHGKTIEVYGFPTDGGGLPNWHSTFMDKLLPEYDFDALIIGDFGDDLARKFIVFHSTDKDVFIARFDNDKRPRSQEEFTRRFAERRSEEFKKIYDIVSDEEIDALLQRLKKVEPAHVRPEDCFTINDRRELAPDNYVFSSAVFMERYGEPRFAMLSEIVRICKERGFPVIFSCLPTRNGLLIRAKEGRPLLHQVQTRGICEHFDIHYFDGYDIFSHIDPQALVDFYWLKHDGHWGTAAANLYAIKLAEWILMQKIIK